MTLMIIIYNVRYARNGRKATQFSSRILSHPSLLSSYSSTSASANFGKISNIRRIVKKDTCISNNNNLFSLSLDKSTKNCLVISRTVNSNSRDRVNYTNQRSKRESRKAIGVGLPAAYRRRSNKNVKSYGSEQRSYDKYNNKYNKKQQKDLDIFNSKKNSERKYSLLHKTYQSKIQKACEKYNQEPTEQNYRKACLKLRQAISSLSSIRFDNNHDSYFHRHHFGSDNSNTESSDNTTPNYFQTAFQYLQQLEELRLLHSKQLSPFVDGTNQNYSNNSKKLITFPQMTNNNKRKENFNNSSNEKSGLLSRIWNHFFQTTQKEDMHNKNEKAEESIVKMSAHLSSDYTANLQLYKQVMKSCLYHHHQNRKDNSSNTEKTNQKNNMHSLRNQLQKIIHQMEKFYCLGNIHVQPDLAIYQYLSYSLTSLKDVQQNLLISPSNKSKDNINNFVKENNYDDLQVLVLKTLKQIIMSDSCSLHDKRCIVETAEKTWEDLLSSLEASKKNHNATPIKEEALQYLLTIYKNAGRKFLPDACARVDKLLPHVFDLPINDNNDNDADDLTKISPNLVVHHLILSIFANSNSLEYLQRAQDILKQMEQYNHQQRKQITYDRRQKTEMNDENTTDDRDFDDSSQDEMFNLPSTQTYNNIMKGIVHYVISNPRQQHDNDSKNEAPAASFRTPAMWLTQCIYYLDTMILNHNETSRPNRTTFSHLLKLCAYSQSPDAGDIAQTLLSRIQVLDLISTQQKELSLAQNNDIIIHPSLYIKVMDCWKTSAWSGRKDAASSAQSFLYRIQAQCSKSISMTGYNIENEMNLGYIANTNNTSAIETPNQRQRSQKDKNPSDNSYSTYDEKEQLEMSKSSYNDEMFPNRQVFYHILIRTCSITRLREDKPKALQIAFDTYREMIDSSIVPGWEIYSTLLQCCRHLCSTPQHRYELSQTVFEAACQHGRVNSILLKELKKTNTSLYRSYQPCPEHSMYTS